MYISYSGCWHKEFTSWPALPEFGILIKPDEFLNDIQTYDYIRAALGLLKAVMSIVNQYDTPFNEETSTERWYRDFWKSLSGIEMMPAAFFQEKCFYINTLQQKMPAAL